MAHPIAVSKAVRRAVGIDEGLNEFSTEEMYREILSRLGEDPNREGLLAGPGGEVPGIFDQGLRRGSHQNSARGALQRGLRRDGDREGH